MKAAEWCSGRGKDRMGHFKLVESVIPGSLMPEGSLHESPPDFQWSPPAPCSSPSLTDLMEVGAAISRARHRKS